MRLCRARLHQDAVAGFRAKRSRSGDRRLSLPRAPLRCLCRLALSESRLTLRTPLALVLPSAGLAIVEQFGDLAESVAKRRFGVKDSIGVIPGHAGLLARRRGPLAASLSRR